MAAFHDYRRWAYESAALDLALRQAGLSLGGGGRPRAATGDLRRLAAHRAAARGRTRSRSSRALPALRFKLDPTGEWDAELVATLAATGAVDTVDLKGAYKGTPVDQARRPGLYGMVAEGFPAAWIEDPDLNERDRPRPRAAPRPDHLGRAHPLGRRHRRASRSRRGRIELQAVALRQRAAPLRRLRLLRRARDRHLRRRPVGARPRPRADPVPGLLFHPSTPNDVAPAASTSTGSTRRPGLPTSPLEPEPSATGFRWG